jgi:hypothetical protein
MVRIEIPMLPPAELNPNARVHWTERATATKELRKAAWAVAYNENPIHEVLFEKAKISVTFVCPGNQVPPDPDNAMTMLKPALDGLVDAKILRDDTRHHVSYVLPYKYEVNPERAPLIIMEVEADGTRSPKKG